ncbi:hypothetical protein ACFLY7_02540, partial [Patescibacteria group bacterium]
YYQIICFLIIFLALITPWLYRNYQEFGKVGMTAQPAYNLYMYFTPSVISLDKGTSFRNELANLKVYDGIDEREINLSNMGYFVSRSIEEIKNYPLGIIKSFGISEFTFFTHDGTLTALKHLGIYIKERPTVPVFIMFATAPIETIIFLFSIISLPVMLVVIMKLFWLFTALIFFFGIYMFLRNKEKLTPQIISALFLVCYFGLTTAINGLGVNARFRQPVNIFIYAFALYGLFESINCIRLCKNRKKNI